MRYLLFHVTRPLPCWVRSHGRSKEPNKNIFFGVGEERHGVLPGSPLCVCRVLFIFHALPLLLRPTIFASIQWLLVFHGQVTHVDLLNKAMDKATILLQHSTRGIILIPFAKFYIHTFHISFHI